MRASNIAKVLGRSWKKTVLFIVLLTLVGMFLCLSGSVWASARRSITKAEESFTTIVALSQPALREVAGLKKEIGSLYLANDLASNYRDWAEYQSAWERYVAINEQIQQTGLSLSQAQPDSRRMAMAHADGIHSAQPETNSNVSFVYFNPPHDRVAYIVECIDTAAYGWEALLYTGAASEGTAAFGVVETAEYVAHYSYLPFMRGFAYDQPGVDRQSGQYAVAAFKVEEILALPAMVVREPQWLTALIPLVQLDAERSASPEQLFETGKRYLILGRHIDETRASKHGAYIQKVGGLSDDPKLKFPDPITDPKDYPLVDRRAGVDLLPKDWVASDVNSSATNSKLLLQDLDFSYDEVRVELTGSLEDFLSDPANRYWKDTLEDIRITNESVQVLTTDNTESLFPFNQNKLRVIQGRDITPKEYADGANVCLISQQLAHLNKIQLGDALSMRFYPGRYSVRPYTMDYPSNSMFVSQPMPYDTSLGLTDTQEFTVVGIYSGDIPWDTADYSINANTVILPDKAMPYLADVPPPDGESVIASPLLYGLTIPNGQAQAVYDELSGMEYGRLFAIMDQGYSVVMPGLITIRDNAAWLMLICLIAWVAILALFLVLFILRQRNEVAIMRSLGAGRGAAVGYLIAGVAVVTLASALLSAGSAYALYDAAFDVALRAPSMETERIDDYSVMPVTRNTDETKQDQLRDAFVPENKGLMILGIIGGQWLLLALASYICSRRLSGNNPMLMMQSKEE